MEQTPLTEDQKVEATARIERVKQFMLDNEVDVMAYPQKSFVGLNPQGVPVYGDIMVTKLMDTKYAAKDNIPSPFGNE